MRDAWVRLPGAVRAFVHYLLGLVWPGSFRGGGKLEGYVRRGGGMDGLREREGQAGWLTLDYEVAFLIGF